jgi:hypothetical protein
MQKTLGEIRKHVRKDHWEDLCAASRSNVCECRGVPAAHVSILPLRMNQSQIGGRMHAKHYINLLIMTVLMFITMYGLMYAMVDRFANVYPNLNQFYMAGLMTAPMVLIELALMRAMYEHRMANIAIVAVSVVALAVFWFGIREQVAVGDAQFLKSMIPHHAGAVLMCEKAPLENAELQDLCRKIIADQNAEISQMKALLSRLQ